MSNLSVSNSVGGTLLTTSTERNSGMNSFQEDAAIDLPAQLFRQLSDHTSVGMFFGLYEIPSLFPIGGTNSTSRKTEIYSRVLAATVGQNITIKNLKETVNITFRPLEKKGKVIK